MDLKRRLSVKAQLPLKKKQNSKTFPLTWDQKNNSGVGINNKFVLKVFEAEPAGVGNRYLSGDGSGASWWGWWWVFLKANGVLIYIGANMSLITYGFVVFFLGFWDTAWPELNVQALYEALKLKLDIGYNLNLNPPTEANLIPLPEEPTPPKNDPTTKPPKVKNVYLKALLAGVYSVGVLFSIGMCANLVYFIFRP
jgi:hypothetical protein